MKRFHYLDSMRGLAALSVMLSHYCATYTIPLAPQLFSNTLLHFWWDGFAAVSFFFVLSGFVLSYSSMRDKKPKVDSVKTWISFLVARICRLHIAFFVVMVASLCCLSLKATQIVSNPVASDWLNSFWISAPSFKDFLINISLLSYHDNILVPQAWTLSIEFLLSLFVPFGILLAQANLGLFCVAMLLGLLRLEFQHFLFQFSLGIALAGFVCGLGSSSIFRRRSFKAIYAVLGLLFYSCRFWRHDLLPENIIWMISGIGSALLILAALLSNHLQGILLLSPLRLLGKVSYSFYLLHFLVLMVATPRIFLFLNHLGILSAAAWALGLFFSLFILVVLSYLCERFVEQPGISLGKKITEKIN